MKDKVNEIKISYKEKTKFETLEAIKSSSKAAKILFKHWDKNTIGLQEAFQVLLLNNSNKKMA